MSGLVKGVGAYNWHFTAWITKHCDSLKYLEFYVVQLVNLLAFVLQTKSVFTANEDIYVAACF